ncbi:hypothetical protein KAFR_0C01650 [Kazachstania africana CBS 2517]|uniref:Major facilitator superfamily (MFS) profile domain-containing protein n=1 Tax=Kazachstania africana (strain ATCC 22294 / BCRC 22015 / CBS 2517 / CECT 1963 / NBRC 1671 / NRRL Y-8276) TaxID=1071382 RepID=H2AS08_KAZAF|nr:hypothetical protein KAFR_0C01650 [Kazachstania africana CBS 2517]CCF57158.1 hypothetical protein KAFR_0C01650 [Kazachstania africana CBS 2517]
MIPLGVLAKPQKIFTKKVEPQSSTEPKEEQEDAVGTSGFNIPHSVSALKKNNDEIIVERPKLKSVVSYQVSETERDDSSGDILLFDHDKDLPDGGLKAWLVVFGSFIGLIPVFGIINSLGAIESYIAANQLSNVQSSTIAWIFSLYLAITFVSCIFAGGYFDRNGSLLPMVSGTVLFIGGIVALADSTEVWHFILSFSVLCAIGSGVLMTPLVGAVATWFLRKRAIATSIATMGGSVGGIMFAPVLRKLYAEVGFRWAIRIFALICFFCLICSICLVKERSIATYEKFESKKELIKWYVSSSFNWRYFLDWKFLFAALGASLAESSLTSSATYISSYSIARGNSISVSYNLITATNAAGILGRYIPGYLADKYVGRFNIAIITIGLAAIANLVIWLPFGGQIGALWTYVILYGFASGSVLSLTPVCIGQISSTEEFGKRYSTAYLLQAIVTIPVLPIGGAIIGNESISNYNKFIVFNSVLMGAGAVFYYISRYICIGAKLRKF